MSGWIKIHRKILENPVVCKDGDHIAVWMYLLLNATHKEHATMFKGKKVILQPGQLITGRIKISEKFKISESKVQRILKSFENEQQIEQQTSNENRLISILSWADYQKVEQQNEQPVNDDRTTDEQPVNTNKNEKNLENDKTNTDDDKAFARVNDFYQRNVGHMPPSQYEYVKDWLETYDADVLILAIRRAVDQGAPKWTYVNQVLNGWLASGAKTLEDCNAQVVEYDRRKGERYGKHQEGYGRTRSEKDARESEFAFLDR